MKRILLNLSFDGTCYHGWQIQPNAITVQEVLQNSLEKILGVPTAVTGCSRTDAGVHAKEFCCHIDCDDNIPETAFLKGLNAILPPDIAVNSYKEVDSDFHARYDAMGKTYVYRIFNSSIKDAFWSRYSWQIERELDVDLMNKACEKIVGTHDFYGFSSSRRTVDNTVRTVTECYVEKNENRVILTVTANGFLYNMVRIIVGTVIEVSDKKIPIDNIERIFTEKRRDLGGITAPAVGLMLNKVHYR